MAARRSWFWRSVARGVLVGVVLVVFRYWVWTH